MKTIIRSFAVVAGCCLGLLALPRVTVAQGWYLNADAGVAIANDVKVSHFITPTPGMKFELDPGPRLDIAGGYNFNDFLGVQLETGFIVNNVNGLSTGGDIDAVVSHVPLLVDFVIRYDKPDCKFVPFVGIGCGGDISSFTVDHALAAGGTTIVDGSASTAVFAWQAFAGARYKLNEKMSIGGAYRYFSANGATWDVDNSSGDIKSGAAQVHSIVVDFTIKF
jgi:opacity protein-like surface antigen